MLTVGSLFSGIGGMDLGLERAGFTITWQVENDPYCNRILRKHWPSVMRYGDIRAVDWTLVESVDLVSGGFPCQPVSVAGKRRGQADERWLWPEFARCLRILRPRYILIENVPGLLVRGFGDVLRDLAAGGYDAEWDCLPASALGAPHRRDRVWLIAYTASDLWRAFGDDGPKAFDGRGPSLADAKGNRAQGRIFDAWRGATAGKNGDQESMADASSDGLTRQERSDPSDQRQSEQALQIEQSELTPNASQQRYRQPETSLFAGRSRLERCGWWAVEPDVGRVAHGVPHRVDRLKGLGNAVVPQVVEWIGRRLLEVGHGE